MNSNEFFSQTTDLNQQVVHLHGAWNLKNAAALTQTLKGTKLSSVLIDAQNLETLDTAGALLLRRHFPDAELKNFTASSRALIELVAAAEKRDDRSKLGEERRFLGRLGKAAEDLAADTQRFLAFFGETVVNFVRTGLTPLRFRYKELFVQLEHVCVRALPIVALMMLLIGVVIAYLFAGQIERYGANIFIVDGVAISLCRELSPVLVAIIVAGRSGSAFTAQIGTMKLNEEIDAMRTLGLSPFRVLIFPRLFALMISLPLLVFIGDIVGLIGGIAVSEAKLGISPYTFVDRLQVRLPIRSFLVGIFKAPVFAAFIALIACRRGLMVEGNAQSVGINTTATVVESLMAVILLDALFAVVFVELGI
ncbi:ABC transporter permease [bacterium]|nr:ABC transporter permease [bacterium]